MSKLIFYIPSLKSGGAEKQCSLVAAELKKAYGYDIEIVTTHSPDNRNANLENFKRVADAHIPVRALAWYKVADVWKLFRLFRVNRGSILICYMTFPNFVGGVLGRLAGVRAIYGGVRTDRLPLRFMIMEYIAHYLFTNGTVFNSWRAYNRFTSRGFLKSRSIVITNAIGSTKWIQTHNTVRARIRIITVGVFNEAKDYRTWLEVVNACAERGKVEAVIIGYGMLETSIKEWIAELQLGDIVTILPGNDGCGIAEELSKADVYLNTSIREGTSNSILEAMRAGLPVVATDVGDNAKLITDGCNGFVAKAKDVVALSEKLRRLIFDGTLRRQFGENSRIRIASDYSIPSVVAQYRKLFGEI